MKRLGREQKKKEVEVSYESNLLEKIRRFEEELAARHLAAADEKAIFEDQQAALAQAQEDGGSLVRPFPGCVIVHAVGLTQPGVG